MILCDTNILIEFYKNTPPVVQELQQIGQGQLAISVITQAELYYGALNKTELQNIRKHLAMLHRFPLDLSTSNTFLQLLKNSRYTSKKVAGREKTLLLTPYSLPPTPRP